MRSFIRFAGKGVAQFLGLAATTIGLNVMATSAFAQTSLAGSTIRNVAEATYFDTGRGMFVHIQSNVVEARVSAVPALEVTGRDAVVVSRGGRDQFYFAVENTGNVDLDVALSPEMAGDAAALRNGRLFHDVNANGAIDAGEPELLAGAEMLIAPGARAAVIFAFEAAPQATSGQIAQMRLMTRATPRLTSNMAGDATPLMAMGTASAEIVSATLEIEKRQAIIPQDSDTVIRYDLRLRNNSDADVSAYDEIDGATLRIDGAVAQGVLMRDDIPLNAGLVEIVEAGGTTPLYHIQGDAAQDYTTTAPTDLAQVDAVAFFTAGDFAEGFSASTAFTVQVSGDLGPVQIDNIARSYVPASGGVSAVMSNMVSFDGNSDSTGSMSFVDPVTAAAIAAVDLGNDVATELFAGACNLSDGIDSMSVTVVSHLTGDVETVLAYETAGNSGIFRTAALPVADMASAVAQDGVMASARGDRLTAQARCGNRTLTASLLVEPGNFAFDAITNEAVADAPVALIDAASGREIARARTDERGYFAFGDQPAGRYTYALPQAASWSFPTVRRAFDGFGRTLTQAAFGAAFDHGGGRVFESDVPLDPFYPAPVALIKEADRDRVTQGGFVTYTLNVTNNMRQALIGAEILDRPPYGVTLVEGSVTLDGEVLADPVRDAQGDLRFDIGDLVPLGTATLEYVMTVGAATREGDLENTALASGRQAGTGVLRSSAPARAVVRLDNSGGVFSRQGTVLGTVFMDCNANGVQDLGPDHPDEQGIAGVRIVTQEGLFVVTDRAGKYSLPGLRPVTHAFQVQSATLPTGTGVMATRTNDLRQGGSRIVPLRRGELRTENFAVTACTPEAIAEVAARRAYFDAASTPQTMTAADLPIEGARNPQRSVSSEAGVATTTQLTPAMLAAEAEAQGADTPRRAPLAAKARQTRRPLESLIRSLDSEPGFLDIEDGQVLARRSQTIRVKGKADLTLGLLVNGQALGADRVGEQTSWPARNVQASEFVAVKLRPGANTLSLIGRDGFGIERMRHDITVTAPGDPARIDITMPAEASADPVSMVPVVVRLLDARGLPVPASATVTLDAGRALWDVDDIRPGTPGVQAFIDNGEATFNLIPPQVSGADLVTITSGFASAEARIAFTPNLEERIMIGVVEGAVALGGGATGPLLPKDQFSHFEDTTTGLRGELYLKGAIRGDALLTLRYSSDRDTEDRLFRDIRGDEYYPVYGDNSERGWDAQSSTNLYVKVERGRSYVLYGDIAIQPEASSFKLGGMRRVAAGAKAHWEDDRVSVTVFAARTAQEQQVVEFAGRGVSGPYDLALGGYVDGSERVEIIVRDEDGGDILSTTTLRRGTDYILDYFRDTITFDTPVRQFDADGNPVSVRVTYEVEPEDADRYWLYGGEVNYVLSDSTQIGVRAVHADAAVGNPARERLQSAYVRHTTAAGGVWEAEAARSEDSQQVSDTAFRLAYDIRTTRERLSFEALHTGRDFRAGGLARPGTSQLRLSYGLELDRKSDLELSAEYLRDRVSDSTRSTVQASYARRFSDSFRGKIGVELSRHARDGGAEDQAALLLGGHWTPKSRPGVAVRSELRLPIAGERRDDAELTLAMSREAKPGWRVHNEIELTFGEDVIMTRARFGMEYQLTEWLSGTTEFSEAAGDSEETWHQGLSIVWDINTLTTLRVDLEHSRGMDTGKDRLTSAAFGVKWRNSDDTVVGDADFDATFEESGNTYYASLGMAGQVNEDWTILGRSRIAMDQRDGKDHLRTRTRIGASYRPVEDPRLDVLAWYEHRLEQKHNRSETHMWSVDASYEADDDIRLNGKYAGQHQRLSGDGFEAESTTQLVQAGAYFDLLDDRMQLGVNAAHLWDSHGGSTTGLGAELGVSLAKGTLLAVGYNAVDARVKGLGDLYQEGAYFRFNLLLDERLWDRLDGFLGN
ncbi:hypothetical protein [Sagittula sp. SSi028]|uniref:hypothetical protein n=1 Tax=Sagittula sp. SSi028 TaxID=3400636 RepID=UPI003AF9F808